MPTACAASMILDSLTVEASGLASAGLLAPDGLSAITTDMTTLDTELFATVDPCLPPSPI